MTPQTTWQSIAPQLEDAIASLRAADRQAILLRFYQQLSFTDVATALRISEEAARKRVTRAVAKLRDHFAAGTPLSADALAAMILSDCVRTAPAHLSTGTASSAATNLFRAWLGHIRLRLAAQLSCLFASLAIVATAAIVLLQPPTSQRASAQSNPATQPIALSAPVDSATRPSNLTFDQVLARIQQTEHAFQNVHVKNFQTTTETRKGNQGAWTPSPISWAGSVWLGADPNGSERLYLADEVLPWIDGAAPWAEQADDVSWDGAQSIELRLAGGSPGRMIRTAEAFIEKQKSMELDQGMRDITGLGFTAQYYVPYPLSQTLQRYAKHGPLPQIWEQTVNGFDTIRLHYTYHKDATFSSDFSFWFAPGRGFAFVKEESTMSRPNSVVYRSKDVLEFKQVAPNLWFPSRVVTIRDTDNTGDYTRYTYHADQITVNDPHFDAAIFHAPIPTAWFVSDLTGPVPKLFLNARRLPT